jgi:cell division topological specificity factor
MLTEILERFFTRTANSRQNVKDRLRFVLAHDRTALPPHILEAMRREILEVVSRYVELETEAMEFSLENDQRSTILTANLPIRRLRNNSSSEEEPVDVPNLEIPELAINEDGDAIATSMIDADPADLEEKVSPETEPDAKPEAELPNDMAADAELITADLDLSNLDFSPDSATTDSAATDSAANTPASDATNSDGSNSDGSNSESAA